MWTTRIILFLVCFLSGHLLFCLPWTQVLFSPEELLSLTLVLVRSGELSVTVTIGCQKTWAGSIIIFHCHNFIDWLSDGHKIQSLSLRKIPENFPCWNYWGRTIFNSVHEAEGCKLWLAFVDGPALRSSCPKTRCRKMRKKTRDSELLVLESYIQLIWRLIFLPLFWRFAYVCLQITLCGLPNFNWLSVTIIWKCPNIFHPSSLFLIVLYLCL